MLKALGCPTQCRRHTGREQRYDSHAEGNAFRAVCVCVWWGGHLGVIYCDPLTLISLFEGPRLRNGFQRAQSVRPLKGACPR